MRHVLATAAACVRARAVTDRSARAETSASVLAQTSAAASAPNAVSEVYTVYHMQGSPWEIHVLSERKLSGELVALLK